MMKVKVTIQIVLMFLIVMSGCFLAADTASAEQMDAKAIINNMNTVTIVINNSSFFNLITVPKVWIALVYRAIFNNLISLISRTALRKRKSKANL